MALCRNLGCTNWVLADGDECFLCSSKGILTYKPIKLPTYEPITPLFFCSKPGCFNTVSGHGDVCSSCRSASLFHPRLSYFPSTASYSSVDDGDDDDVDELFKRAKSAYRRERRREQERIRRSKDYAYDWVQAVIGFLTAILNFFSTVWAACCYISTAVARHFGLSDDCYYLSVLRRFRDKYILDSGDAERISDLKRYYEIAPDVLTWINEQPNADAIWSDLAFTIAESVKAIECEEYDRAYELYKTRILNLQGYIQNQRTLHEDGSKEFPRCSL